jgi:hypothetical protein
MALLHIYDADDASIVSTATSRVVAGTRVKLPITGNGSNFLSSLDGLVGGTTKFDKILFETHGSPGQIFFGNAAVSYYWVSTNMRGRKYESLCPGSTRIYFNGCNVAAEPGGRLFMENIARIFLLSAGGSVFGHTSLGLEIPIYSWLTGHVVHLTGDTITLYVGSGGKVIENYTQSDV